MAEIPLPVRTTIKLSAEELGAFPDLWARMRAGFSLPDLDSPDVEQFAWRFAHQDLLRHLAPRARLYLHFLVVEAESLQLPTELALLPIIESGLNPLALSPAKAAGLCQFIPETGRRFGLHQSSFADRRHDLACVSSMYEYLQSNARLFDQDWFLALASYNWGEGAVTRAVVRNRAAGLPVDYLSLRMPRETRQYVPQLLAIKKLISDPERYGISLPHVPNEPMLDCDVAIPGDMDVAKALRFADITEREFRFLNPGVKKGIITRATHPSICLPIKARDHFLVSTRKYSGPLATLTARRISTRTSVATLAKLHGMTAEKLKQINQIPNGMRLKPGATILVPRHADTRSDIPETIAQQAQLLVEPDTPEHRKVHVKARATDTIQKIARRYSVKAEAVLRWNPVIAKRGLREGQQIVLFLPVAKRTG